MSRVLTIFRKDVRHLWPQVLMFFAIAALAVVTDPALRMGNHRFEYLAPILEPVACWVLIVAVIHEERLIGHEQYWLTRPYTWKNLVAAKALFLAVFVSLPLFVCQCIILVATGLEPLQWLSALLWRQVFFAIFMILPAVAFAAVTANLAQVLLCVVVSFPFLAASSNLTYASDWGGLAWIRTCATALVVLGGVAAVVTLQYTRRRTGLARVVVAATLALAVAVASAPRWGPAFAVQRLFARQTVSAAAISLSIDASAIGTHPAESPGGASFPDNKTRLDIPLRVAGLPPGMRIGADWVSVTMETPGAVWHSGWLASRIFRGTSDGTAWIRFGVDRDFYDRWKDTPVRLSATADLTIYQHVRDVEVCPANPATSPGFGGCEPVGDASLVLGTSPFLQLALTLEEGPSQWRQETTLYKSFAPFPTTVDFRPFDLPPHRLYPNRLPNARLSLDRPVAYIQRHLEAREIRLKDLVRE